MKLKVSYVATECGIDFYHVYYLDDTVISFSFKGTRPHFGCDKGWDGFHFSQYYRAARQFHMKRRAGKITEDTAIINVRRVW